MKKKKKITAIDMAKVFLIIGLVASILIVIMNFINGESKLVGIILLCTCSVILLTCIKGKEDKKK